ADISLILLFKCVKRLTGPRGYLPCAVLALPLVAFNAWISWVYSDSLSLPVGIGLFLIWLIIKEKESARSRLLWSAAFGALVVYGYLIKPTNIVAAAAVAAASLYEIWRRKDKPRLRSALKSSACAILCAALLLCVFPTVRAGMLEGVYDERMAEEEAKPVTHFIMMGMNIEGESLGEWSAKDEMETSFRLTQREKIEYNISVIKERLAGFGPFRYVEFLLLKMRNTYMQGNLAFFGGDSQSFYRSEANAPLFDPLAEFYFRGGSAYQTYCDISDGLWALVMLLCAASVFRKRNEEGGLETALLALKLSLLGQAAFFMLFETSPRYIVLFLPLFVLFCTLSFTKLPAGLKRPETQFKTREI
ncbi:MAG: hypothetical protein Q4B42_03020, partial [Oscillospiraceae bacterium]|nr:hypothetical protein [Oscillospiraceae bacterium]